MNQNLLEKYAKLTVVTGANVQKDQLVVVRGTTETKELVRLIAEEAYLAGAKRVQVEWSDDFVSKSGYKYMSLETLEKVPSWFIEEYHMFVNEGACFINISSPIPGLNKDIDASKMQKAQIALQKELVFYRNYMMGNKSQWTIVAYPNAYWAKQVFPDLNEEDALQKMWDSIFKACRVLEDTSPIDEWNRHNETFIAHNIILNDLQFESIHFTNSLGTNLTVQLVENHVWAGGGEETPGGVYFNPNIPTEETFTMPYKYGTQGKVVSTKPLNYQGKLIEDFWMVFKDGKVVEYGAKKEEDALKSLIDFDEGSCYLGEVALISHDSPISNLNILFLNTLFDENASCHLALGMAFPMNVQNGNDMTLDELKKIGYNYSMSHTDFMFGSSDMTIVGKKKDGTLVKVFEKGNFVI